jgi:hypothetical protein
LVGLLLLFGSLVDSLRFLLRFVSMTGGLRESVVVGRRGLRDFALVSMGRSAFALLLLLMLLDLSMVSW